MKIDKRDAILHVLFYYYPICFVYIVLFITFTFKYTIVMDAIFEYFSGNLWQIWALVCMLCLILELFSGDFFIMCFAIGALLSVVTSVFGVGMYIQLAVFIIVSVLSIFFVRPFALRYLHSKEGRLSNAGALIGRIGTVSTTIVAGGDGRVAVDGDDWKAVSVDGTEIEKGEKVRIISMESIIITVEKVN